MGKQSRKKASKPPRAVGPRATPLDLAGALAPFELDILPRTDVFHPPEHMLDGLLGVIAMRREKGAKELSDELDVSWGACAETLLALLGDADAYAREKFVGRALAPFYAVAALERLVGRSGAVAQTAAETERLLALSVAEPAWDEEYRDAFGEPFGARVADLFARVARGEDSVFDAARRVLARLPPLLDGAAYRTKRARDARARLFAAVAAAAEAEARRGSDAASVGAVDVIVSELDAARLAEAAWADADDEEDALVDYVGALASAGLTALGAPLGVRGGFPCSAWSQTPVRQAHLKLLAASAAGKSSRPVIHEILDPSECGSGGDSASEASDSETDDEAADGDSSDDAEAAAPRSAERARAAATFADALRRAVAAGVFYAGEEGGFVSVCERVGAPFEPGEPAARSASANTSLGFVLASASKERLREMREQRHRHHRARLRAIRLDRAFGGAGAPAPRPPPRARRDGDDAPWGTDEAEVRRTLEWHQPFCRALRCLKPMADATARREAAGAGLEVFQVHICLDELVADYAHLERELVDRPRSALARRAKFPAATIVAATKALAAAGGVRRWVKMELVRLLQILVVHDDLAVARDEAALAELAADDRGASALADAFVGKGLRALVGGGSAATRARARGGSPRARPEAPDPS